MSQHLEDARDALWQQADVVPRRQLSQQLWASCKHVYGFSMAH